MSEQIVGFAVLFVDGALQLVGDTSEGNTYKLGKIQFEEGEPKQIKRTGRFNTIGGHITEEWGEINV